MGDKQYVDALAYLTEIQYVNGKKTEIRVLPANNYGEIQIPTDQTKNMSYMPTFHTTPCDQGLLQVINNLRVELENRSFG